MRRLFLVQIFLLLLPLGSAAGQEYRCPEQPAVLVAGGTAELAEQICAAGAKAIDFLARYQLTPKRTIHFNIVEEKIDSHGSVAYGSYDRRSDSIQLMSYAAIHRGASDPTIYGESFDREHYRGAIAHEVTHAIFQQHVQTEQTGTAPQEYLAGAARGFSAPWMCLPGSRGM